MMKFPKYLSIQTTSLCNASCVFCPYREIRDLFPAKIMEEALFRKIVDECSLHREVERIILYLNNEPLTDPRIVERINYAKEKVPWAGVHILTNGSLLNDSLAEGLLSSRLDWIGISLHGTEPETIKEAMGLDYDLTFNRVLSFIDKAKAKRNIRDFVMLTFLRHKYLTPEEKDKSIGFWRNKGIEWVRYFDGPVSRAGNVSGLPPVRRNKITGCATIWANEMMHIVEDGNVVLCCMDWRREVILGNLKSVSVQEIWSSKEYALVRDKRDGRLDSGADFICKRCEAAIPAAAGQVKPKMRSPFLWLLLSFVCAFTIFYMTYFWAYMHLRNRIILGGSRK